MKKIILIFLGVIFGIVVVIVFINGLNIFLSLRLSRVDPTPQWNQANDMARRSNIKALNTALKMYYSQNGKAPESLDDLVRSNFIASIPLDPETKQPLSYISNDALHGCKAESKLNDGTTITAYCK